MPDNFILPLMRTGGLPLVVSIAAPISRSGSATRSIGRRHNDSSPVSSVEKSCPAMSPISKRIAVPELPKSSGPGGDCRPFIPKPETRSRSGAGSSIAAPIARNAVSIARQSSLARKPLISEEPSAIAPSNSARCEIDLSPGTTAFPPTRRPGRTINRETPLTSSAPETHPLTQIQSAASLAKNSPWPSAGPVQDLQHGRRV